MVLLTIEVALAEKLRLGSRSTALHAKAVTYCNHDERLFSVYMSLWAINP
jgi:hypothetical protein